MVGAPVVALAAVAAGLDYGAPRDERSAIVYASPASRAGTGLAWQVETLEEAHGSPSPIALPDVTVTARAETGEAHWGGATNEDGIAEVGLPIAAPGSLEVDVRASGALLAAGRVDVPAPSSAHAAAGWARFARREGGVALDVAVLGQRVAAGFPAVLWVRATDAGTRAALAGVEVGVEDDPSLARVVADRTDARGWARLSATPVGHVASLLLHARAADGRAGEWAGALFVSPGAPEIVARDRYGSDEAPSFEVIAPDLRTVAYVEVDDASGRAWGASLPLSAEDGAMPRGSVVGPRLAPGLYWAVASSQPAGAASLGPGTIARPFFVAASDASALALGSDPDACADVGGVAPARAMGACLALTDPMPVRRWQALEGLAQRRSRDARRRGAGLGIGLGAIAAAVLLEILLLARASMRGRAKLRADALGAATVEGPGRAWDLAVGVLVALLGFGLLAALLARAG
ncbi:MAG TPA: hypothetical protein VGM06_11850 [Polyangiaceae bacterium]|jgi:hypothetical protein